MFTRRLDRVRCKKERNMKILHCADIHLGAKIESGLPAAKSEIRRMEVREAFDKMIGYARSNGIKIILISGDAFDSERPLKKDKEFFYQAVKRNPDITFYYLRGNHDDLETYTETIDNLKTFGEETVTYEDGFIDIMGIELTDKNALSFYSTVTFRRDRFNILMLHGQLSDAEGSINIPLKKLADKNLNYLALGHIHSFDKGEYSGFTYAYPGCLEGRGFDETGEKGFIVLDIPDPSGEVKDFTGYEFSAEFVVNSVRVIKEAYIDVTGADGVYEISDAARSALASDGYDKDDILRIYLTGFTKVYDGSVCKEVENLLKNDYFYVNVKDKRRLKIDYKSYVSDPGVVGEFIRRVYSSDLTDDEKAEVAETGLKAFENGGLL